MGVIFLRKGSFKMYRRNAVHYASHDLTMNP